MEWLGSAAEDFDGFVAVRRGVRTLWDVPSTVFWYVSGAHYLGTLVVRHELTPELTEAGGNIGSHRHQLPPQPTRPTEPDVAALVPG